MPKLVYNARAQDAIAADLARDGDHDAQRHAQLALQALERAGYHLLTAPRVEYDPPDGSPQYDALVEAAPTYATAPRAIKRTVSAELDDQTICTAVVVSTLEVAYYDKDGAYKAAVERKQGVWFVHEMWTRLAPETAMQPGDPVPGR